MDTVGHEFHKNAPGLPWNIWERNKCWISLEDLRWGVGENNKEKRFVHKIPFDFNGELIECIIEARYKENTPLQHQKKTNVSSTIAPTFKLSPGRLNTATRKRGYLGI